MLWKMLMGASGGGIAVSLASAGYPESGSNPGVGQASAGVKVKRDGNIESGSSDSSTTVPYADVGGTPNQWAAPSSSTVGDAYHVRMVTSSGALDVGTADTWLALTSDRSFEVNVAVAASKTWFGKMQLSKTGGATILRQTSNFELSAVAN